MPPQPAWVSLALTAIIALLAFADKFAVLRLKTDRLIDDSDKMAKKLEGAEQRLNDLVTVIKVAGAEQSSMNEMMIKALATLTDKLEKIDGRVMTSEAALLVLTNHWPDVLAKFKKIEKA